MASTSIAPLEGWITQTIPAPGPALLLGLAGVQAARRRRAGDLRVCALKAGV
jgi:hypothetical protein